MYKTTSAFLDRLQYTHQRNGTWKAEFHGAFDIVTVADTLEHCRDQVQRSLTRKSRR